MYKGPGRVKKQSGNPFALVRLMVLDESRREKCHLDADIVNEVAASYWDELNQDIKEEWRQLAQERKGHSFEQMQAIAKDQKFIDLFERTKREVRGNPVLAQPPQTESVVAANITKSEEKILCPYKMARKLKHSGESVLAKAERLEMQISPEVRRSKQRYDLIHSFSWNFDNNPEELRKCRFVLLSCTPLLIESDLKTEPAEIACVVMSIDEGIVQEFCSPVLPFNDRSSYIPNEEKIAHLSSVSHQLSLHDLRELGKSYDYVVREIIKMSCLRDQRFHAIKFFIVSNEHEITYNAVSFMLSKMNDVNSRQYLSSICDTADAEDLLLVMSQFYDFQVFEIDGPEKGNERKRLMFEGSNKSIHMLDLFTVLQQTGVDQNGAGACDIHERLETAAECCLGRLKIVAEAICSSVRNRRLDIEHLQAFTGGLCQNVRRNRADSSSRQRSNSTCEVVAPLYMDKHVLNRSANRTDVSQPHVFLRAPGAPFSAGNPYYVKNTLKMVVAKNNNDVQVKNEQVEFYKESSNVEQNCNLETDNVDVTWYELETPTNAEKMLSRRPISAASHIVRSSSELRNFIIDDSQVVGSYSMSGGQNTRYKSEHSMFNGQDATPFGQYTMPAGQKGEHPMPSSQCAMPAGQFAMPGDQNTMYECERPMHNGQDVTPFGQCAMPGGQNTTYKGERPMPSSQYAMPVAENTMHNGERPMPSGQDEMPVDYYSKSAGQCSMSVGEGLMSTGQNASTGGQYSMPTGQYSTNGNTRQNVELLSTYATPIVNKNGNVKKDNNMVPTYDTLSVQHLLLSGRRGIGRGLHLLKDAPVVKWFGQVKRQN